MNQIKKYKRALQDVIDLTQGYDGFDTVEGLKSLIDDIRDVAVKPWEKEICKDDSKTVSQIL